VRRPGKGPRALVIAPTRELATQIATEIGNLARYTKARTVILFGGIPDWKQKQALRQKRPDIIVGCPGRLLDLYNQGALHLDHVSTLVLDEADHMFDMGFLPDIKRILNALPSRRQNLLFSATMPKPLRRLADEVLNNPHVATLADTSPAETIDHALYPVEESRKRDLLNHILGRDECTSAIVFTRTKHRARRLADQLTQAGYRATGLQGNMSQSQRDRAMRGFRTRNFDILVATDIASRGIDVRGVSHVINYDAPNTPQAYTHRIGRTGRSEQAGVAYTLVTSKDVAWIRDTERMIGEPIARANIEGLCIDLARADSNRDGSRNGARRRGPKRNYGGRRSDDSRSRRQRRGQFTG
jgi:ATP-dependent RNA helicase RhlE